MKEHCLINVSCYGRPAQALIDTGATRSLVSEAFVASMPGFHEIKPSQVKQFVVANGASMSCHGIVTLPVYLGHDRVFMKFHVVSDLAQTMIIGRDYLMRYRVKINYSDEIITLDLTEGLFSVHDTTIPPKSSTFIQMRLRPSKHECTVNAVIRPAAKHNLSATLKHSQQIAQISEGRTHVEVQNKGNQPICIGANQRIATATIAKPGEPTQTRSNVFEPTDEDDTRYYRRSRAEYRDALNSLDFSGSVLSHNQIDRLKQAIWPERDVLSVDGDLGCLKNYEYHIELKEEKPFNSVPYRLSPIAYRRSRVT
jgi:hypothetical protein